MPVAFGDAAGRRPRHFAPRAGFSVFRAADGWATSSSGPGAGTARRAVGDVPSKARPAAGALELGLTVRPLPLVRREQVADPEVLVDFVEVQSSGGLVLGTRACLLAALVPILAGLGASWAGARRAAGPLAPRSWPRPPSCSSCGPLRCTRSRPWSAWCPSPLGVGPRRVPDPAPAPAGRPRATGRGRLAVHRGGGRDLSTARSSSSPTTTRPTSTSTCAARWTWRTCPSTTARCCATARSSPRPRRTWARPPPPSGSATLIPYSPLPYLFYYALHRCGLDLYWAMTAFNAAMAMLVAPLAVAGRGAGLGPRRRLARRASSTRSTWPSGTTSAARTRRRSSAAPWARRRSCTCWSARGAAGPAAPRGRGRRRSSAAAVLGYSSLVVLARPFRRGAARRCWPWTPGACHRRRGAAWRWRWWSAACSRARSSTSTTCPGLLRGAACGGGRARPLPRPDVPHLPQRVAAEPAPLGPAASGCRSWRGSLAAPVALRRAQPSARPVLICVAPRLGADHAPQGAASSSRSCCAGPRRTSSSRRSCAWPWGRRFSRCPLPGPAASPRRPCWAAPCGCSSATSPTTRSACGSDLRRYNPTLCAGLHEGRRHRRGRLRRLEPRRAPARPRRRGPRARRPVPRQPREPRGRRATTRGSASTQGSILDPAALAADRGGRRRRWSTSRPGRSRATATPWTRWSPTARAACSVLRACRDHGVRRMVLASTSDCYGRNPEVPFSEESVSVIGSPARAPLELRGLQDVRGAGPASPSASATAWRAWPCASSAATAPGRT